jgi:hypothetical protein
MLVERSDLFDFKVTLTQEEFDSLRRIADKLELSLETAFTNCIDDGLEMLDSA